MKERIECEKCGALMKRTLKDIEVFGGGGPEDAPVMQFVCKCGAERMIGREAS